MEAKWLDKVRRDRFGIKTVVIGGGDGEVREAKVLNRVIRKTDEGWEYEADHRHAYMIIRTLELEDAHATSTAGG